MLMLRPRDERAKQERFDLCRVVAVHLFFLFSNLHRRLVQLDNLPVHRRGSFVFEDGLLAIDKVLAAHDHDPGPRRCHARLRLDVLEPVVVREEGDRLEQASRKVTNVALLELGERVDAGKGVVRRGWRRGAAASRRCTGRNCWCLGRVSENELQGGRTLWRYGHSAAREQFPFRQ